MTQHIPTPPLHSKDRRPVFDLFESDDDIIEVLEGSDLDYETDSESEIVSPSNSRIEPTYECWRLIKAPAKAKEQPNWKRAERFQVSLPSDELAKLSKRHRKTESLSDCYNALSADQRQHVEVLIREKKLNEIDPQAEWELADIHRELFKNYKTRVRETTFIRVILKRRDKRRAATDKKTDAVAFGDNIVDLSERAHILSLGDVPSKKKPTASESSIKDKDQYPRREKFPKVEVIVDRGKAPTKSGSGTRMADTYRPIHEMRKEEWQGQPLRHNPQAPIFTDQKAHLKGSSTLPQTQNLPSYSQAQARDPRHAAFASGGWPPQSWQPAQHQRPEPQKPTVQQPMHFGAQQTDKPVQSSMQQPGSSDLYRMTPQQPQVQQPISSPHYPSQEQQPVQRNLQQRPEVQHMFAGTHQQPQQAGVHLRQPEVQRPMPSSFQQPAQAQQPASEQPEKVNFQQTSGAQYIFGGLPQQPQHAGVRQQPHSSFSQQSQTAAQTSPYTASNISVPQTQPTNLGHGQVHSQPQQQSAQPIQPRALQDLPRNAQIPAAALQAGSGVGLGQLPREAFERRIEPHAGSSGNMFATSNVPDPARVDPIVANFKDPRYVEFNAGRTGFQQNESNGHDSVLPLPRREEPRMMDDERIKREEILRWSNRLGHSRSSSSFDDHSSAIPSVERSTPQTSISGGYPIDRKYGKQPAQYQFSSDHPVGHMKERRERVNIMPARSGQRATQDEILLSSLRLQQHERPVIHHRERRDRAISVSPERRKEKKNKRKQNTRRDESSSSESSDSDSEYEPSSKKSSKRRSRKGKKKSRKDRHSPEYSESSDSDDDCHYTTSTRSRGRESKRRSSKKARKRSNSPRRRFEDYANFDASRRWENERPSLISRKSDRTDSDTASAVDKLNKRLQLIEEMQAEEAARKLREAERKEAYEKGLEDAIAWKRTWPTGFPGLS